MKNVVKILSAIATIAGAVYIIATYGEQIVAWAKKLLNAMPKCPEAEAEVVIDLTEEPAEAAEAVEEEAPAEEVPAEETAGEAAAEEAAEEPAPEVIVAENEPVAEDTDFAE